MKIDEQLFTPGLTIENEDILLRTVTETDISELVAIASDVAIWQYFTVDLSTEERLSAYVVSLLNEYSLGRNVPFVIIDKHQWRIVGMSSFGNISPTDKRIEIGWSWLGTRFQGTGRNGVYKHLLIQYAFEHLDVIRVEFKTDVLNIKARKALLKIGAVEEGVLRSHTQMHSDRRRDTIYYSILRQEWEALKANNAVIRKLTHSKE